MAALLAGCGTMRGVAALRQVDFSLERIQHVRLAGMALDDARSLDDVSPATVAAVAAGALFGHAPLEAEVLIRAANPASNPVTAEIVRMDWTLLVGGHDTARGRVDRRTAVAPGQTALVPVRVAVDLGDVLGRQAAPLLRVALALAGGGPSPVLIRLRLHPLLETPFGALRGPAPITIPLDPR